MKLNDVTPEYKRRTKRVQKTYKKSIKDVQKEYKRRTKRI